jgi:hypothetical protein
MARLRTTLGIAAAACAATTLLAGAALAGNPHNPSTGSTSPGHGGTPPGQAKKGTNGKSSDQHGKALGKAKKGTRGQAAHPSHPAHTVTPAQPSQEQPTSNRPAFAASKGKGHEKTAHHKVIICHRTGSATNPYVVINVSINGWLNGHTKHPAIDGRSDILLKDPAAPGEKLPESMCPQPPAPAAAAAPAAQPRTATPVAARPTLISAGAVKGATSTLPRPARTGGVLGAMSAPVIRAQLPFTGLALWPVLLAGIALLSAGAALRRRSA